MKKLTILISILAISTMLWSQSFNPDVIVGKHWTNGNVFYLCNKIDRLYNFSGGTLHEGGYSFGLLYNGNKFDITRGTFGFNKDSSDIYRCFDFGKEIIFKTAEETANFIIKNGQYDYFLLSPDQELLANTVEYQQLGGDNCLIFYNKYEIVYALVEYSGNSYQWLSNMITKYLLSGVYTDSKGNSYTFSADKQEVFGFGSNKQKYTFATEFDMITNVLQISNDKNFMFVPTKNGMDIYLASRNKEYDEVWTKGRLFVRLTKVKSLYSGNCNGIYAFASEHVLPVEFLTLFSSEQLRIMRNEIYARYGKVFQTKALQDYFVAQTWYTPKQNTDYRLTTIEKINIATIQKAEKSKSYNNE